jgi:hypothetical protein
MKLSPMMSQDNMGFELYSVLIKKVNNSGYLISMTRKAEYKNKFISMGPSYLKKAKKPSTFFTGFLTMYTASMKYSVNAIST